VLISYCVVDNFAALFPIPYIGACWRIKSLRDRKWLWTDLQYRIPS